MFALGAKLRKKIHGRCTTTVGSTDSVRRTHVFPSDGGSGAAGGAGGAVPSRSSSTLSTKKARAGDTFSSHAEARAAMSPTAQQHHFPHALASSSSSSSTSAPTSSELLSTFMASRSQFPALAEGPIELGAVRHENVSSSATIAKLAVSNMRKPVRNSVEKAHAAVLGGLFERAKAKALAADESAMVDPDKVQKELEAAAKANEHWDAWEAKGKDDDEAETDADYIYATTVGEQLFTAHSRFSRTLKASLRERLGHPPL